MHCFSHYSNRNIGADKRAPTETPNTKKKQSIDAARLCSPGSSNIFGPYIIAILPIYPFDIDIEASNKRNISSDAIYTYARKYYIRNYQFADISYLSLIYIGSVHNVPRLVNYSHL